MATAKKVKSATTRTTSPQKPASFSSSLKYDHKKIEPKWQKYWDAKKLNSLKDLSKAKKPFYPLVEFPFPSGAGLHTGHIRSYTAFDIIARKKRAEGFDVLYPMGWDAFGLPTENFAIKTGIQPAVVTKRNTDTFRRQLKAIGLSFDWSREVNTTDPKYYKWTQWLFLQFYKQGLAYKAKIKINWCPKDKIGLANEEVVNGCCERCGTQVEERLKEQWMLKITAYADRLDKDLDLVDYLEPIKLQQRNWIGRKEGAEIDFSLNFTAHPEANQNRGPNGEKAAIKVFTTRPETIFGATYLVLSPEHLWVTLATDDQHHVLTNKEEVRAYVAAAKAKTEIERTDAGKTKTGVELKGVKAINPATGEEIPVFVADYVLANYGTGAIMAVPAHDDRDFAFAQKFNLPIKEVVIPNRIDPNNPPVLGKKMVERRNVHTIVRKPQTNKFLFLKSKTFGWTTLPMGGVEEGEDIVEAGRREVAEETGYTNLKFVKVLGGQVRAQYFAKHKDENRTSYTQAVMFDLIDETRQKIEEEDFAKDHEILWLDKKEITSPRVVHAELADWLERWDKNDYIYTDSGVLIDSGSFTGQNSEEAKKEIVKSVGGKMVTTYKLRDWVFSRQRYWGEPIPMVYCEKCGWQPISEKDLPLTLPKVKKYEPTDDGESPLSTIPSWVKTKCPKCKGVARRETDTMPNWAGSSWYFLRYLDPKNNKAFVDKKILKKWLPVNWYNGGMEHTTLHLLYSRFWYKFMYDQKLVPTPEPYAKRTSHGLILAEGGEKMSKSKGNVVNPDELVKLYGADTLRLYEMFMGPFKDAIAWNTQSLIGLRRFIERIYRLLPKVSVIKPTPETNYQVHSTIQKVTTDIDNLSFNTAVSQLMVLLNHFETLETIPVENFKIFLRLIAPFAPHFTEEIWQNNLHYKSSIHLEKWPKFDPKRLQKQENLVMVQVNGRVRGQFVAKIGLTESEALAEAKNIESVGKWLNNNEIIKIIYIPDRLINFVVKS